MNNKKKITFSNTNNCITIRVYDRKHGKSHNFYVTKNEIEKIMFHNEVILSRDIYSYCRIHKREDKIYFEFDWLDKNCNEELKGYSQDFAINAGKFQYWYLYNKNIKNYTCLNVDDNKTPKFVVKDDSNLQYVIENPTLRKKFTKGIQRLMHYQSDTIELYNDFNKESFFWKEYRNGTMGICGGLIFHHDYENKEDLSKGYYSIHT